MTVVLKKKDNLTTEQKKEVRKAVRATVKAVSQETSPKESWKLGTLFNWLTGKVVSFWDNEKKTYHYDRGTIESIITMCNKALIAANIHWTGDNIDDLIKTVKNNSTSAKKTLPAKTSYSSYRYPKVQTTQDKYMEGAKVAEPKNYTGFTKELLELLLIQAPSGHEEKVREYLIPVLDGLVDEYHIDAAGNLLAIKKCGTGEGATVMLSAHMDSVSNIDKDRVIMENDGKFFTTAGALGADDRAGIAVVLGALRAVGNTSFNGTIKVAFPVSEEIGCVGSGKMDTKWYEDVNLAIVIDRRGSRDIVTGCTTPWNFCSEKVGDFLEECSAMLDMDYKCCGGGVSDAMTFSNNGINSVNLSAGYYNEHTSNEYVVVNETKETLSLVVQALALINDFYKGFGEVPAKYSRYGKSSYSYWSDNSWLEDDWVSKYQEKENVFHTLGSVEAVDVEGSWVDIHKSTTNGSKSEVKTISMFTEDFEDMIENYLAYKGYPSVKNMKDAYDFVLEMSRGKGE